MKTGTLFVIALLLSAALGGLLTVALYQVDQVRWFNDGFTDGLCAPEHKESGAIVWEDGNGRPCY